MTYGTSSAAASVANNAANHSVNGTAESDPTDSDAIQTRLSCLLEGLSPAQRNRHRTQILERLHLLDAHAIPVFDEATQTVSRLLAMPICLLSVMDADMQWFKSVVGLSSLGLMNQLAATRSIPRIESFCTHVIDSGKTFSLADATAHPAFSHSLLVQQYGIQSYLGVPLMTSEGCCIGTLAVMDLMPHLFTQQEVAFLELSARWCMSEFEKQHILTQLKDSQQSSEHSSFLSARGQSDAPANDSLLTKIHQAQFDLVMQLTQDLRSPLTSITGMANMLSREIYGPLSEKQQEYAKIVLSSSQRLLAMVDEIVEVGELKESEHQLALATVDIEMVGQQALAALGNLANQQDLQLKLTVEPGSRLWNLDKHIVKQLIYHLVFSLMRMSTAGSTIRLHISRREDSISLALWVSNPWLGEDLPQAVIAWDKDNPSQGQGSNLLTGPLETIIAGTQLPSSVALDTPPPDAASLFESSSTAPKMDASRQELGLLLSRHFTNMHGGEAFVQGSAATGYRYVITLPSFKLSV
ncbi:MAG: GAF domain-containing sensor histidine kinase [Phormidesmis sp. RL_2_1]|nr:GAF domain-containing sensor histidine kinase [Phormidesmis sp. RL_2_1]